MNRWIQLFRPQSSYLLVSIVLLTRWVAAGPELVDTMVFIVATVLFNSGTYSMNEWCDREHDRGNPHKVNPITEGSISATIALRAWIFTMVASMVIFLAYFPIGMITLLLVLSYVSVISYNIFSKRTRWSPLIGVGSLPALELWIIGLSGFPAHALWIPLAMLWFLMGIHLENDWKDMEYEDNVGTGNRSRLMVLMILVQVAFLASFIPLLLIDDPPIVQLAVIISIGGVAAFYFLYKVQHLDDRPKMIKAIVRHNFVQYCMVIGLCTLWVPIWLLLCIIVLPVVIYLITIWIGYGTLVAPKI